jgi:hypothetical protein
MGDIQMRMSKKKYGRGFMIKGYTYSWDDPYEIDHSYDPEDEEDEEYDDEELSYMVKVKNWLDRKRWS